MGRIGDRFEALRARGERALVVFITAGDPDIASTEALIRVLAESGADIIEIGVPFSDPIAEGPTIQRASERALARGTSLRQILAMVGRLRDDVDLPLLLMGYANPLHAMGPQHFAEAAAAVGVDGIIIPDLPPEEGEPYFAECRKRGIDPVLLAAPTTSSARLASLVERTCGFLYYVSLQGVTGARDDLAQGIEEKVAEARKHGDTPICVGFGISKPEHAALVGRFADGVVVGSAFVAAIEAAENRDAALEAVSELARALKAALSSPK
jgi:tryptophan synthase alpha chain